MGVISPVSPSFEIYRQMSSSSHSKRKENRQPAESSADEKKGGRVRARKSARTSQKRLGHRELWKRRRELSMKS